MCERVMYKIPKDFNRLRLEIKEHQKEDADEKKNDDDFQKTAWRVLQSPNEDEKSQL